MGRNTKNDASSSPASAEKSQVEELLTRLRALSREDKRLIIYRMLCDMIGEHPEQEYGIYTPEGRDYMYLIPPRVHLELEFLRNPGLKEELDRRMKSPGKRTTVKEILARAKARVKQS
jgi:hypothetical protein